MDISIFKSAKAALLLAVSATAILLPAIAQAQSYPPLWSSTSHYAVGDQVQENGNVYRCTHAVTAANLDPSKIYTYWELSYVRENTTLFVGPQETFPTLQLAWNYILNCSIAQPVYLHIYLSSYHGRISETHTTPFSLDHPFGANISIIGDNYQNVVFTFDGGDGFAIDNGHTIASLTNVSIYDFQGGTGSGLHASWGATIGNLAEILVSGFYRGVYAFQGAHLNFTALLNCSSCPDMGVDADGNSVILMGSQTDISGSGIGIMGEDGGYVQMSGGRVSGTNYGAYARNRGTVDVGGSTLESNTYGAYATLGGFINAYSTDFSGNATDDVFVNDGGIVYAFSASLTTTSIGTNDGSYILYT